MGNLKLGASIAHFDLPAGITCPGKSDLCYRHCYARQHRFRFAQVRERLAWNLRQARRGDFPERVVEEVRKKGVLVCRLHVSGDFFDAAYAAKWLAILKRCPKVRFYCYTRSYRVPAIADVLEEMAALRCMRLWYSIDAETGVPLRVPVGVRLAYLQVDADDQPELVDLLFRIRRLRREKLPLSVLCPNEAPGGRAGAVNCGNCQRCWQ